MMSLDEGAEALDHHRADIAARAIHVTTELRAAPLVGDPGLIDRVTDNLVDNAVTHNVDRGRVTAATGAHAAFVFLDVTNTGPVIAPDQVAQLFEPFQRGDRTASDHAGIGLSIVRSVVHAHGGTVVADARPEGGLRVVVRLPISPSPVHQIRDVIPSDTRA